MAAASFAVLESNGSEQFRHLWHYRAIGKTRVAPKTSTTTTAWWAGVELGQYYTIGHGMSNQRSETAELPQHKPGSPWKKCNLGVSLFCNAQA